MQHADAAGNTGEDEFIWTVDAPPSNSGCGGNRSVMTKLLAKPQLFLLFVFL